MIKPRLPKGISVRNEAGKPAEIAIRGIIGTSYDSETWSATDTEETFLDALSKIPAGTKINVRINSKGGEVGMALGIYNAMQRREADITCYNDGYALSAGSIIMLGGGKRVSPDSSIWMIHCAASYSYGNAADMRKSAEMLDAHDKTLVAIYAKKTGMAEKDLEQMMASETWMTGIEAKEKGFADKDTDQDQEHGDHPEPDEDDTASAEAERLIVSRFKNIPKNLRDRLVLNVHGDKPQGGSPRQEPLERTMEKLIKALAAAGIKLPDNATDDQIVAAFTAMNSENQSHKIAMRARVEARVKAAVDAKKIKAERQAWWVTQGMADESALDQLDEMQAPQAAAPAPAAAQKPQRGAPPAPPAAESGTEGETTESRILALQGEIDQLRGGPRTKENLEAVAPKIGALARQISALRGDTAQEIKYERVQRN